MTLLRREVLDGLLLRRTKASRAADLSLPSRTILLRDDLELDLFGEGGEGNSTSPPPSCARHPPLLLREGLLRGTVHAVARALRRL